MNRVIMIIGSLLVVLVLIQDVSNAYGQYEEAPLYSTSEALMDDLADMLNESYYVLIQRSSDGEYYLYKASKPYCEFTRCGISHARSVIDKKLRLYNQAIVEKDESGKNKYYHVYPRDPISEGPDVPLHIPDSIPFGRDSIGGLLMGLPLYPDSNLYYPGLSYNSHGSLPGIPYGYNQIFFRQQPLSGYSINPGLTPRLSIPTNVIFYEPWSYYSSGFANSMSASSIFSSPVTGYTQPGSIFPNILPDIAKVPARTDHALHMPDKPFESDYFFNNFRF